MNTKDDFEKRYGTALGVDLNTMIDNNGFLHPLLSSSVDTVNDIIEYSNTNEIPVVLYTMDILETRNRLLELKIDVHTAMEIIEILINGYNDISTDSINLVVNEIILTIQINTNKKVSDEDTMIISSISQNLHSLIGSVVDFNIGMLGIEKWISGSCVQLIYIDF